jgi:Holliday junction resolvasome RuvABC endonuclease subunit
MKQNTPFILSLFPYSRGVGYACLQAPQNLLDSGVVTIRPISNERIVSRINKFLEFHQPTVVVIRDIDAIHKRKAKNVQKTIEIITDYAKTKKLPLFRYTRQQIREAFEVHGAKNKYETAQKIVTWFPYLASKAPEIRMEWMDEDYNMCMFDAIALAVTHLHFTA